jgi:hypothetical protein
MSDGCCDDTTWICDRINATRALIVKYEAAIDALSTGAQSYQLDTGQTRQLVSKVQLPSLLSTLSGLEARLATYEQRLGCARLYVRPGW